MSNTWPFEPYKIDTYFNKPTSYGTHEGCDFNGLGGGNTDCGYELKSICSGEVVNVSTSSGNYGKLLVIKTTYSGTTYFVRYAHCQDILVQSGNRVREGQVVALMGSTGNSTACHLHLDVLKNNPPHWRYYTQNVTEWFVDPVWFIKNYKEDSMSDTGDLEKQLADCKAEQVKNDERINSCRKDREKLQTKVGELQTQLADTERGCQKQLQVLNDARSAFFKKASQPKEQPIENYDGVISLIGRLKAEKRALEAQIEMGKITRPTLIQRIINFLKGEK